MPFYGHSFSDLFYLPSFVGTECNSALAIVDIRAIGLYFGWRCAKSPDFVPFAICHSYFSNLYFPVFVDYWNSYEVRRLRRAITVIFCCYDLFILRRAGDFTSSVCCRSGEITYQTPRSLLENENSISRMHSNPDF